MASRYRVPFSYRGSMLDDNDLAALTELVSSSDPLSAGRRRDAFEAQFAEHIGTRYAMSVTSGTVALEIAIGLLDLVPGDEVIATPQTYQATIQPLLKRQVHVRFCDVEPRSLNIDPEALRPLLGARTRAIILVHYGGYPAEMDEIMALARQHGAVVIEDCAHTLGASYHARRPGGLGDIGCFSFHSTKNITTLGEGGMLTFNRDEWAARVERIRSNEVDGHFVPTGDPALPVPASLPWMKFSADVYRYSCLGVTRAGTNATMSEAAAAVGITQLAKLEPMVARRRWIASQLDAMLEQFPNIRLHQTSVGLVHAHHLYTFFVDAGIGARDKLVHALDRRGVEIQLRYFPLHLLPEWRWQGHGLGECPVAEASWFSQQMNLPCHPGLSDMQIEFLLDAVENSVKQLGNESSRTRSPIKLARRNR
jgi:perosamine synthetase